MVSKRLSTLRARDALLHEVLLAMRRGTAALSALVIAFSVVLTAQGQEFARVLRNGEQATLSVFGPRPVDLAAKKLVDEFRVVINVEDPLYFYSDDVQFSHVAASGKQVTIPRASLLEVRFNVRPDGSLQDIRQVLADLVETANVQLPFAYRIDRDGETLTLVATRTRDEQGRSVDLTPILDRRISIPLGTRRFFEHVNLLTHALEKQTGVHVGCCTGTADNQPGPLIAFRADDEPARSAFLRLVRSRPARSHLVRSESGGYHLVTDEPGGYHWLMRCQPGDSSCFINLAPIPYRH
jgi:hypothetical protein